MGNKILFQPTFLTSSGLDLSGAHGLVVGALGLYWGGVRFESLSTHHCWTLSKSFISSLVVWSMTKNTALGGEKQKNNKKSNGGQSDLCDLGQVTWARPHSCKYGTIVPT